MVDISSKEPITDKDGKPTPYFIRMLKVASEAGRGVGGRIVRSVNGISGDVIIDIDSLGLRSIITLIENTAANVAGLTRTVGAFITSVHAIIAAAIVSHNESEESHPFLSAERSSLVVSKMTGDIISYQWHFPHTHNRAWSTIPALWGAHAAPIGAYNESSGMGLPDIYPSPGAAAGIYGTSRNVYVSAFYIPFKKIRVRGLVLPIGGGQRATSSYLPTQCYASKAAIYTSRQSPITGGRPVGITGASKALTGSITLSYDGINAWGTAVLSAPDYLLAEPEVGGYISTCYTGSNDDCIMRRILTVDGATTVTYSMSSVRPAIGGLVRTAAAFYGPMPNYNARWLDRQVWSSVGYTDYTTNQSEGWILNCSPFDGVVTTHPEVLVQGQCIEDQAASLQCDIELEQGIHFLVITEAAIGNAPQRLCNKNVVLPAASLVGLGERQAVGTTGKADINARGYMSTHSPPQDEEAQVAIPLGSMSNSSGRFAENVNFFCIYDVSDATTVAAIDDMDFEAVMPETPYTADNMTRTAFTPILGDGYAAPASSAHIMPFMFSLAMYGESIE